MKARDDEGGRTVDIMRFLVTYGLDLTGEAVDNHASFSKTVKESVRKLMKEMKEFSDKEFSSGTVKGTSGQQHTRLDNKSTGHQIPKDKRDVLMKQGDWICPKYFSNKFLAALKHSVLVICSF